METILFIICTIGFLITFSAYNYLTFQSYRNNKVYEIRLKWIDTSDIRFEKYSYYQMYKPSLKNILGLKTTKESHFPFL